MGFKITVKHKGNFNNTQKFMKRVQKREYLKELDNYGQLGVELLRQATPVDSGETANSWSYKIEERNDSVAISWHNSNSVDGIPIVTLLVYGHGTNGGGYVQGNDFVTPIMKPLLEEIDKKIWKGVTK